MLSCKLGRWTPALALAMGVALSGCEASKDGQVPFPEEPAGTFKALYFSTTALGVPYQPWPSDLLFSGTTDGTVNIPASLTSAPIGTPLGAALNTLDGFSTTAYTSTNFGASIDPASITASSVRVIELNMVAPNTPSSTAPVSRVLAFGTDFKAEVSPDVDSDGKILRITPLKPFRYSKGAQGVGYLFVVTNGLRSTSGEAAVPDDLYASSKAAASCSSLPAGTAQGICAVVKWQLGVAGAVGVNANDVVVSWNYTTQSVDDTFDALTATVGPQTIAAQMVPGASSPLGAADLFAGTLQVPYYSKVPANANDRSILLELLGRRRAAASRAVPERHGPALPDALQPGAGGAGRPPHHPGGWQRAEGGHGLHQACIRVAGGHRHARSATRPHRRPRVVRQLRLAVLRGGSHRPGAARHHEHRQPVLSGGQRAYVQRRPD